MKCTASGSSERRKRVVSRLEFLHRRGLLMNVLAI